MRRIALAVGVVCAVGLSGRAQFNSPSPGGSAMPGQTVGTYRGQLAPLGKQQPQVAPSAGQPIAGDGTMKRPYDPNRPYDVFKGSNINPNSIVAPLTGPDGKPVAPPDALDRLSDRIRSIFVTNSPPPRAPFAPGVIRRSRSSNTEMMWRRD